MVAREPHTVVVGGGLAGCSCAITLATLGVEVTLVDPFQTNKFKIGESLPGAARKILAELGAEDCIPSGAFAEAAGVLSNWGSSTWESFDTLRNPEGTGWHIDRRDFEKQLVNIAIDRGVIVYPGVVKKLELEGSSWLFQLANNKTLAADFFVDASGKSGLLSRSLKVSRVTYCPTLATFAALRCSSQDRDDRILLEAQPDGWWYSVRVPQQKRLLVKYENTSKNKWLDRKEDWLKSLRNSEVIRHSADLDLSAVELSTVDASSSWLSTAVGQGWIAVGDAALAFDPLASQGMFFALYSGLRGAQAVGAFLTAGVAENLASYQDRVRKVCQSYVNQFHYYYQKEQRWAEQPFWSQRHHAIIGDIPSRG